MRDFLKTLTKSIAAFALVGVTLIGAVLFMAAQKGETQGGKKPAEVRPPARLTVNYVEEIQVRGQKKDRSRFSRTERKTLDATFIAEVLDKDYWKNHCERMDPQARKLYLQRGDPNQLCYESSTFAYPSETDMLVRLVSVSGQSSYSLQEEGWEKISCFGMKVGERKWTHTRQGGGAIPPDLRPGGKAGFDMHFQGERVHSLNVEHEINYSGEITSTYSCPVEYGDPPTSTRTQSEGPSRTKVYFYLNIPTEDPHWSVQVNWTGNGYTGIAQYRRQSSFPERNETEIETKAGVGRAKNHRVELVKQ